MFKALLMLRLNTKKKHHTHIHMYNQTLFMRQVRTVNTL